MYFFTAKSIKILPKNYVNYQQQYFRWTFDPVKNYMHDIITKYIILLFHGWLQNNVLNFQTHHNRVKVFIKSFLNFLDFTILQYFYIFLFFDQDNKVHIPILRRPLNFAKSPPQICPMQCQSNLWWRFCKILQPSQNI